MIVVYSFATKNNNQQNNTNFYGICSAVKRNEVAIHVSTRINLGNIVLNERIQAQKITNYVSVNRKSPKKANLKKIDE